LPKKTIEIPVDKKSSIQKICEALDNQTIDKKTAVLLAIQAVHEKNKLPEAYEGDKVAGYPENLMAEYQWIRNNFDKLTESEKSELEPYILSPDNERSFFYPDKKEQKLSFFDLLLGTTIAYAADNNWKEIYFSAPGKSMAAVIHYYVDASDPNATNDFMEQEAKQVEKAFTDSWTKFKELLQCEPGQTIHVYIGVANLGENVYGLTQWNNTGNCTVSLTPLLDDKKLKSTAVHELFHCFQVSGMGLALNELPDDMEWLLDATATWSEHFIYPDYNREHEYLNAYFNDLDNPLIAKYKRYNCYMFFYYLQAYLQDTSAVPNALKKAKTSPVSYVLPELVADFNAAYYMYAGCNYNKEPLKFYQDTPSFPAIQASENPIFISESVSCDVHVRLEQGAMRYDLIDFSEDIEKIVDIEFKFAAFEEKGLGRRALIKVGGEWHEEDWSGISRRKFCRNEPSENVEQVLLIHSIADLKGTLDYTYFINTYDACNKPFKGSITITANLTGPANANFSTFYKTQEDIQFDEEENCYVVKKRQIDYTGTGGINTRFIVGPEWNEIDLGAMTSSFLSTGHLYEEYDTELYRKVTGNAEDGYCILLNPDTNNKKWVTTISRMLLIGTSSVTIEKSDGMNLYFNDIEVKPEEVNGKRLKGTRTMNVPGGTAILEFDYTLP